MMKKVTWVALLVSILGAALDWGGSEGSTAETAAELAMVVSVLAPASNPAGSPSHPGAVP